MRKQVFIGFIAVFTLLVATGCGGEPEQAEQQEQQPVEEAQEMNGEELNSEIVQIDISNEVDAYLDLLDKRDLVLEDCDILKSGDLLSQCKAKVYTYEAIGKLDVSICNKIEQEMLKNECVNAVEAEKEAEDLSTR